MPGGQGRPLRFLALVTSGWIGMRVVMLWPDVDSLPALGRAILPIATADPRRSPRDPLSTSPRVRRPGTALPSLVAVPIVPARPPRVTGDPTRIAVALLGLSRYGGTRFIASDPPLLPGLPRAALLGKAAPSRWSGSAWLVARGGGEVSDGLLGGQLGGSQVGLRLAYAIDQHRRIAAAARVTSPLGGGAREIAVGIEWQPTRLPIRVVAEERIAIADGHSGPSLGLVGGAGPIGVGGGFRLEGYGQAGVIRRAEAEAYVDGAVHLARPVARLGQARLDLGAGAWGAAQRGAARLDVGPSLTLALPVARQPVRLSLDWRERVAGRARPGSGLAFTLGADF